MADEHQRYERLAVGHVVGGLDEVDSARFRSHLVACRDCRTRVAELRGIASDLVATEREERAARATVGRTELAERVEEEAPPTARELAPARAWPWRVVAIGLAPLLLLGALSWAVWMRAEATVVEGALATSTQAHEVHAEGRQLPLELDAGAVGITGVVSATSSAVAVDLGGLPDVGPNRTIRAVLLDADGDVVVAGNEFGPTALERAWLYDVLERRPGARTLAIQVRELRDTEKVVVQDLATASLPE